MIGKEHLRHMLHCLRSKAGKDIKATGIHAEAALRRLRLGRECERILHLIATSQSGSLETHEVATALGWVPPLVHAGRLNEAAQSWLDSRYGEQETSANVAKST